ncbi:MAG: secondary thiamine-phosphate synthase enzyme YjbQ [Bacteroidota bacterium]|nr:secondary thiamine-phosphate synthase enzyme YjbQ [Bacteroidota bacterium]
MVEQTEITLPLLGRGFHLITSSIESGLPSLPEKGLVNIFIHHTSAALAINENADPTVRMDFESFLNRLVPENDPIYKHKFEGPDDMPAHLKSSFLGQSISIPVKNGRLHMGTWQGIYLCEFRNSPHKRKLTMTVIS